MQPMRAPLEADTVAATIIPYAPQYRQAFRSLNLDWLSAEGVMEDVHHAALDDPEGTILAPGGTIFVALLGDRPVGTIAAKAKGPGQYELTKFTVVADARGLGIGDALCRHLIAWFTVRGGTTLCLETSSKLKAALRLYERLGFRLKPHPTPSPYVSVDRYMEWEGNHATSA